MIHSRGHLRLGVDFKGRDKFFEPVGPQAAAEIRGDDHVIVRVFDRHISPPGDIRAGFRDDLKGDHDPAGQFLKHFDRFIAGSSICDHNFIRQTRLLKQAFSPGLHVVLFIPYGGNQRYFDLGPGAIGLGQRQAGLVVWEQVISISKQDNLGSVIQAIAFFKDFGPVDPFAA